ncbi:MAG: sigma-70 family RNA polymerase sigma factor [Lachnospiraceae bacterium]|nr:sigma-70 family RNA polymerase sigma factor [Lachnospiraceae bacterium]
MSTYDCCIWDGADWFTKIRYVIRALAGNLSERIEYIRKAERREIEGQDTGKQVADRSAIKARETERQAERLLDQYGNSVLRLAYSYLRNMSDAEEILQETLIRYLQTAPEFENSAHEKAWLMKVAANLSKNRIDYNQRRATDELKEELLAQDQEDVSFVWEAVKVLPEQYRETIHLFYYEGYSTAQIARILTRKESSVRSDLRRGREKLKQVLKEAYDFE